MDNQVHNSIVSFIWGIADDCLRDVYVRGKYRDVILPMTVIRRLDALLEDSKDAVLEMKKRLDAAKIDNQWPALCNAAGQAFCNASPYRLCVTSPVVPRSRRLRQTSSLIWMVSHRMCRLFWISSNSAIRSTRWWMPISSVLSLRSLCLLTLT